MARNNEHRNGHENLATSEYHLLRTPVPPVDIEVMRQTEGRIDTTKSAQTQRSKALHARETAAANLTESQNRDMAKTLDSHPVAVSDELTGLLQHIKKLETDNKKLNGLLQSASARDEDQIRTIKELKKILEKNKNERGKATQELDRSMVQSSVLQQENDELKHRLFKSQPTDVLSDAQIHKSFEALWGDIEDWVDTNLGDTDNIVKVISVAKKNSLYAERIEYYLDVGLWEMLRTTSVSQIKFLICAVQRFVMNRVLSPYAFGMPAETARSLATIERQMGGAEQAKDHEQVFAWRADTVRAFLDAPSTVDARERALKKVTDDMWYLLKPLLAADTDHEEVMKLFHDRVTLQAFALSRQIRTSPVAYNICLQYDVGTKTTTKILREEHETAYVMIDVDTGSKIRRTPELIYDQNGGFGRVLCILFPGLDRVNSKGQKIKIGKATLLVQLNKRQHQTAWNLKRVYTAVTGR